MTNTPKENRQIYYERWWKPANDLIVNSLYNIHVEIFCILYVQLKQYIK